MPGEMEWDKYEKAESEGLELPDDIENNARELASWLGEDFESCVLK